jgi:hypothetical protein
MHRCPRSPISRPSYLCASRGDTMNVRRAGRHSDHASAPPDFSPPIAEARRTCGAVSGICRGTNAYQSHFARTAVGASADGISGASRPSRYRNVSALRLLSFAPATAGKSAGIHRVRTSCGSLVSWVSVIPRPSKGDPSAPGRKGRFNPRRSHPGGPRGASSRRTGLHPIINPGFGACALGRTHVRLKPGRILGR